MSNKRIDFTKLGGFGFTQDTLGFKQVGELAAWQALARGLGHLTILHGMQDQGVSVSDGYVVINGELLPFVGGAKASKVWVEELTDVEIFADTSQPTVYFTRRARMGVAGDYNLSDFRRWKSDSLLLDDAEVVATASAVKRLHDNLLAMLSFENTIILKGCAVSAVNTGAGTLAISAGIAMIAGAIVATQPYAGAFPAYLKPDGTYATVQPAGDFIAFNPYTSQRYADVLKRATTPVGEIKLFKVLSDRFDGNGLGRWEMAGFKFCDELQSRVPVGHDRRTVNPNDNAWDANHTMQPGQLGYAGGEKRHTLTDAELPEKSFDIPARMGDVDRGMNGGSSLFSLDNVTTITIGGNQAHNNMQPYRVVVYAERV